MIDLHCHIIPNVDDGAKSFEESIEIIRGLSSLGFTEIIATPHYIVDSNYCNPKLRNQSILHALRVRVKEAKIKAKIFLGNEIYIDPSIAALIKKGKISTLNDSEYILVELPMSGEFTDYEDILVSLQYAGYKVILAHPERYYTFQRDFDLITRLTEQGILLQCNLGSFVGQYGRHAKKTAKKIAKHKLIFGIGTDTHRVRDWSEYAKALKKLSKYYDEKELKTILVTNPRKIIKPEPKQ